MSKAAPRFEVKKALVFLKCGNCGAQGTKLLHVPDNSNIRVQWICQCGTRNWTRRENLTLNGEKVPYDDFETFRPGQLESPAGK